MKKFNLFVLMLFSIWGVGLAQTASLPIAEDFELETNRTSCNPTGVTLVSPNFFNDPTDTDEWDVDNGGTGSTNTGPTNPATDHNPGTSNGKYLYTETSGCNGDTAILESVYMNWSTFAAVKVNFWYHMFGAAMGTMHFDIKQGNNAWVTNFIPSWTDNQDLWQLQSISVTDPRFAGLDSVKIRIRGITGTTFTSDMAIDDILIEPILPINVGVSEIQNPVGNICAGPVSPIIGVKNYGSNIIDSVNVVWNINGVVDSLMYVGTILPDAIASVSLPTLNISSSVLYNFSFYTNNPNGTADQFPANDTLTISGLQTGLLGTVTLDPSLAASATNYTSFSQLASVLNNYGVCGPVTVNVAAGTYNESFALTSVPGVSSVNTLTIDGGDSTTTILSHNNTANYGTVTFESVSYVTIRNMRIEATANNGAAILLNKSSHNTFESNVLWANPNSTSTNTNFIISGTTTSISTNGEGSYNTLQNNLMIGGYYSVYMYGSTTNTNVGNVIHNNQMDSVYYYGSYIFFQDSLKYTNNELDQATRGQINGDGLFLYYSSNFDVSGNYIHAQDYGIYFYNFNNTGTPTLNGRNRVVNNMVVSESDWGMYFLYTDQVDLFHNSVATYGTVNPAVQVTANTTNIIDDYDVRNNVFASNTTEAFELTGIPDTILLKWITMCITLQEQTC